MKALTLKHPWAWCIAHAGKSVENRVWRPAPSLLHPGDLFAIHGGAHPKGRAAQEASLDLTKLRIRRLVSAETYLSETVTPGIVAVCRFGGVVTASVSPWFAGPYGWVLGDVFTLPEPIPCKGAQGLWDVPEPITQQILALMAKGVGL